MKTSKRILALMLSALMIFSVAIIPGVDMSMFGIEVDAAEEITIGGITQKRVVGDYTTTYANYASQFFGGKNNWPTDFVIPGLSSADDYTPQGMTYWADKEWILISAYDAGGSDHSVIYAIDAVTKKFVALYKIENADGSVNTSHGGGIAASKYNFYYADSYSKISYVPLAEMELNPGENEKTIRLKGSIDCAGELSGAATSYCCYDDGVLWAGNFHWYDDNRYSTPAHSKYNSLLVGYKLKGNSSQEEWQNLQAKTTIDPEVRGHAGNPTYVIALADLDRVQYAMVDKGKIYISRSWSRTESDNHIRELDIGDMDINSPGTIELTINGISRKCHLVDAPNLKKFGGTKDDPEKTDMFFMGEALCVIDDYLYMFAESAAYAYNGKESNKCPNPIDVIWKIDQHAINDVTRPAEDVDAIYYEKITDVSQLDETSEYIFVFESEEMDPVTQKPILYALDSYGGYNETKLSKKAGSNANRDNTGDSMGIIGYPITVYSTGTETEIDSQGNITRSFDTIYINDSDDGRKSIRWKIERDKAEGATGVSLINSDFYYGNNKYLFFNSRIFSMDADNQYVGISELGSTDTFLIYHSKMNADGTGINSYLWCNDGTLDGYLDLYTNYYKNHGITDYLPNYNDVEEIKGTFHADAMHKYSGTESGNLGDTAIPGEYKNAAFTIYKRVENPYASTLETDVYTDITTELQSDGTYKLSLETYATAAVQYMNVDTARPTDFIFVIDTASSDKDSYAYHTDPKWSSLLFNQLCSEDDLKDKAGTIFPSKFYYKFPDGEFGKIYVAFTVRSVNKDCDSNIARNIWLWVEHPLTQRCYRLSKCGFITKGQYNGGADADGGAQDIANRITDSEFLLNKQNLGWANQNAVKSDIDKAQYYTDYHSERADGQEYEILYHHWDTANITASYYSMSETSTRLEVMQQLTERMSHQIAADNDKHRISLITFDNSKALSYEVSSSGVKTSDKMEGTDFTKIYFDNSQFGIFRNTVNSLTASGSVSQPSIGMDRAANTFLKCGQDYTPTGDRAACVIFMTTAQSIDTQKENDTILRAKFCKGYGAFIYTVKIGAVNESENNVKNFFEFSSSKYINAETITASGDPNRNSDIQYYYPINTNGMYDSSYANNILESALSNSGRAYLKVNTNTIIREAIGDFFFTSHLQADNFSCETIDSAYDGLGRLYFDEATRTTLSDKLTIDINGNGTFEAEEGDGMMTADDSHTLRVKGFDYSTHYVSKSHTGKKLIVTITGLTLNTAYALSNEKVTKDRYTGLYLNEDMLDSNTPRKKYPMTYINVPEYTYVLDYGIGMLDTNVNGTLQSISVLPTQQTQYSTSLPGDSVKNNVTIAMSKDGQNLIYGLLPDATGSNNSGYCLIQRDNGEYDWFKINIAPASNVYFEETVITLPGAAGENSWKKEGTSYDIYQQLTSENDIYGYDKNYMSDGNGFSNGTVYKSCVNDMATKSDTLKFDYTGTAIDLYGSCGEDTGIYVITIRDESGKVEKVYITDTYLSDSSLYGDNSRLNQVPIVHHENKDQYGGPKYGKYTVEITSAYLSSMVGQRNPVATFGLRDTDKGVNFFTTDFEEEVKEAVLSFVEMEDLMDENIEISFCDDNSVLNGGTGADVATTFGFFSTNLDTDREFDALTNYFDGFRVYQPTYGNHDGSYPEYEQGAQYFNVAENLLTADDVLSAENEGIAYIEKIKDSDYEQQDYGFSTYTNIGPKNELYLKPGQAIAFNVYSTNENAKAMVSMRAINGVATAAISSDNGTDIVKEEYTVAHVAEMYYRINNADFSGNQDTIVIENTSDNNILVVDTIKLANGLNTGVMMMSAMPRIRMMMAAPAVESAPNAPIEDELTVPPMIEEPPYVDPFPTIPEEPSTEPDNGTNDGTEGNEEESFFEQLTAKFTELLNMIKSMLDKIVTLLKSIMA